MSSPLKDRKDALENEFFARQDESAITQLREKNATKARRTQLAAAVGITDEAVLDSLEAIGISVQTLTALSLVPLVTVAWADGKLAPAEREAIQQAASEANAGKDALTMLEGWLSSPPRAALLAAWKSYIGELLPTLDPAARASLRDQLVGGAREVAEAAGGFLGFGNKVSSEQAAVLDELADCFGS
jgi:hypothetical protein